MQKPIRIRRPGAARGFTLIELMIVVVVVAILAAIAFPSYQESLRKGRRTDARNALLDYAARQERFYSINNLYADAPDKLGYAAKNYPIDIIGSSGAVHYQLSVDVTKADPSKGTRATFTAKAKPQGAQAVDVCGDFLVTNLGVRTASGTAGEAACW